MRDEIKARLRGLEVARAGLRRRLAGLAALRRILERRQLRALASLAGGPPG